MRQEAVAPSLPVVCALCASGDDPAALINVGGYPLCRNCLEKTSRDVGGAKRRVFKITEGKQIAGVCGGLADHSNMDRDTFRVIFLLATFMTGGVPLILAYVVLAFILPSEP